jgi:hypothetical protein
MEEMDAIDWYRQRAEDTEDAALREILLHNMREEVEHACMILEWLRRNDAEWSKQMDTYLYTDVPITRIEEIEEGRKSEQAVKEISESASSATAGKVLARPVHKFTVGALKDKGD